jgi:hypothetical protein
LFRKIQFPKYVCTKIMTKINCETTSGIFIHEGMKVIKEKRGGGGG